LLATPLFWVVELVSFLATLIRSFFLRTPLPADVPGEAHSEASPSHKETSTFADAGDVRAALVPPRARTLRSFRRLAARTIRIPRLASPGPRALRTPPPMRANHALAPSGCTRLCVRTHAPPRA
jgi:hypothetical protein